MIVIDLSNPFICAIASGIALAIILGATHYAFTLVQLYFIKKKLGDVLTEMYSLNKKHKNEISCIKETGSKIIIDSFKEYQKRTKELIQKYHKIIPPARLALLESLYDEEHKDS